MMLAPADAPYIPQVITHIGAGGTAILFGYAALFVRKGEKLHRSLGTVFVIAMLIMATMGTFLAISLRQVMAGQTSNIAAGVFAGYLAATAYVTVKRKEGSIGFFEKFAFSAVLGLSATFLAWGVQATTSPGGKLDGYAAGFYFAFGGIAALLAALDFKVILRGGISGVPRIARHVWRMCFALFFAAGSFFLGQQKVMPVWMHGAWYLFVLGLAPLAFMVFWLVRIRFTNGQKSDGVVSLAERLAP